MSKERREAKRANTQDDASKNEGLSPTLPVQTFDEYQCCGNVEIDFPRLCSLLDMKYIPAAKSQITASSSSGTKGGGTDNKPEENTEPFWDKPCLHVELYKEDPLTANTLRVSGWKLNEQLFRVLMKMLPSMKLLRRILFWQAGLTDQMVISLMSTVSLCSSLRIVTLEGNTLPERSHHLLLSEDSVLTQLSLRNNRIGDEGARLIGLALSTTRSANKNLTSLNLAFNSIGDAGAKYIAQGLRFNRTLRFLALTNNHIGDSGAAHLAGILCEFALTHEEIVERRKLLLERGQSSAFRAEESSAEQSGSVLSSSSLSVSREENEVPTKKREVSKKDKKAAADKENQKISKNPSDKKGSQSKDGKPGGKEVEPPEQEPELVENVHPLLDEVVNYRDGQLFIPGNTTLISLCLAGNRITEKSLPLILASLEMQHDRKILPRLYLQRNRIPPECESYVMIQKLMEQRDLLKKQQ
ncbi:leucine-rich repeat-containing protein 71 [Mugil cephalus]|uniref:leucine-rich repeat-containing protein 71 n=1 Tax=Mugil cephalus TaxID=48193 RepID=UPI001FB64546|nr:leucine-rich repeat-containing protein 71 [Mugil cephalus]